MEKPLSYKTTCFNDQRLAAGAQKSEPFETAVTKS